MPAPVEPVPRRVGVTPATLGRAGAVRARLRHLGRVRRRNRRPDPDAAAPTATPGGAVLARSRDPRRPRFRRPSPRADADPDADTRRASPSPSPTASPSPVRRPNRHRRRRRPATAEPTPTADADLEPVRAAEGLPGHARLLHLRRSLGRQPVQHRQVLRRPAQDGPGDEPVDQETGLKAGQQLRMPPPPGSRGRPGRPGSGTAASPSELVVAGLSTR